MTKRTLVVENLTVRYGGVKAVDNVSLHIEPGELVGLIGPNGAGKTTFIDAVCGFIPSTGAVRLGERDLTRTSAARRARAGLGRTWQGAELYDDLTVRENVRVGTYTPQWIRTFADALHGRSREREPEVRALGLLGLSNLGDRQADAISAGQRKLVDVARALAAQPEVILLDEPAAGLDSDERDELGPKLRAVADAGTGVLLVDHNMGLVLGTCDRIVVLDFGELLAEGTPAEIRQNASVIAAYLGSTAGQPRPHRREARTMPDQRPGTALLEIVGITAGYFGAPVIRNVSLSVMQGEVVALLGPNGAGKTTTLRATTHLMKPRSGKVRFDGQDVTGHVPQEIATRGLVLMSDRRGIFHGLTVEEHLRLRNRKEKLDSDIAYEYFPALKELRSRRAGLLSGGEQQMLGLARAFARHPKVLMVDELSQGLAPVIVERLMPAVRRYADDMNAGVLLVEQQVQMALGVADQAYVLSHGEVVRHDAAATLRSNQELIVSSYMGDDTTTSAKKEGSP